MRKSNDTQTLRSACPINYALELLGDSWSLLILRDMVYYGKSTYGDFIASDERIARNILADRLERLQQHGIIKKTPHPSDKRKDTYVLLEPGLDLIPILLDYANWSATHSKGAAVAPTWWVKLVEDKRSEMIPLIRKTVAKGGSIFVGDNSVVNMPSVGRKKPKQPLG